LAAGGNVVFGAKVLGEALGPFQRRGGGARSEGANARFGQAVGQAQHQGRFGADNHQINRPGLCEIDQRVDRIGRNVDTFRVFGDAGIAGRAI